MKAKQYKAGWLLEVLRFKACSRQEKPPQGSRVGLSQFHAYESRGVFPSDPDPFFQRLLHGKRWWEWTLNQYGALFFTNEWPGWALLEQDFRGDERGLNQVRRRVEQFRKKRSDDPDPKVRFLARFQRKEKTP